MSSRFESCFELLVSNTIICDVAYPTEYAYLKDAGSYQGLSDYLDKIGRRIVQTNDGQGFYCVYKYLNSTEKKRQAENYFNFIMTDIEGIIAWLRLARHIDPESRPIEVGGKLMESELLAAIEESSSLTEQLNFIAQKLKCSPKASETKTKLRSILTWMVKQGLFVSRNATGSVYEATGKWSHVYDYLEFCMEVEGIVIAETEKDQEEEQPNGELF